MRSMVIPQALPATPQVNDLLQREPQASVSDVPGRILGDKRAPVARPRAYKTGTAIWGGKIAVDHETRTGHPNSPET